MSKSTKEGGEKKMVDEKKEQATPITKEMLEKFRELQKKINDFQKSLKPRKEAIFEAISENVDLDEVQQLIEFSGKGSLTVSGDYLDKKLTVSFRFGVEEAE